MICATAAAMVWLLTSVGASPVASPAAAESPVAGPASAVSPGAPGSVVGFPRSASDVQGAIGAATPRTETVAQSAIEAATPRWRWPVAPPRIVQAYAAPPSPYAAGHRGIDLAAATSAVVVAPSDATVHFAGVVVDRPVLTLDHGSGVLSSYEPLLADGLRAGDTVTRGSPLGVVGTGAHCSNSCLHVGVRIDGDYVSPLLFFDRVPRSVLLPLRAGGSTDRQARG